VWDEDADNPGNAARYEWSETLMLRWLIRPLSILCIALSLATLALWVRSYLRYDTISLGSGYGAVALTSADSRCMFMVSVKAVPGLQPGIRYTFQPARTGAIFRNNPDDSWLARDGFRLDWYIPNRMVFLSLPLWFVALLLLMISLARPALGVAKSLPPLSRRRRQRVRRVRRMLTLVAVAATVLLTLAPVDLRAASWLLTQLLLLSLWLIILAWAVVVLCSVLLQLQRIPLGRLHKRHLCSACGYNMLHSSGKVCPECGTKAERSRNRVMDFS
jgi:hypothetical protein